MNKRYGGGDCISRYYEPTALMHELRILSILSDNPDTTQAHLASLLGLTPAMINVYLRRLTESKVIERTPKNGRDISYAVTAKGQRVRAYHSITMLAELQDVITDVLGDIRNRITKDFTQGETRVVLYGAGETGQVVYLALQGMAGVTVVGVVDDDPQKQGQDFFGFIVQSPPKLLELEPNKVIVASWSFGEEIMQRAVEIVQDRKIEVMSLIF